MKKNFSAIQVQKRNDDERVIDQEIFKIKTILKKNIKLNGKNNPEIINQKASNVISSMPGVNLKSVTTRETASGVKIYPKFTLGENPITYSPTISIPIMVTA